MEKILVDLDIVSNALWKGSNKEIAKRFLEEIKKEYIEIYTPYTLITLLLRWKNKRVVWITANYYLFNSDQILTLKTIRKKLNEANIEYRKVLNELKAINIKGEDALLVLIASIFDLVIYTFNKKHLYNKRDNINQILRRYNLKEVSINVPT